MKKSTDSYLAFTETIKLHQKSETIAMKTLIKPYNAYKKNKEKIYS